MPASTTPLDYSRFDKLATELNSDDEDCDDTKFVKDMQRKSQLLAQHDAMFLLVGWTAKAIPKLSDVETTRLVRFVATCDKAVTIDKVKRFTGIAEFYRTECSFNKPDQDALLRLCHFAQRRVGDAKDANERLAASRVLLLAMGALNTLSCCDDTPGGAEAVVRTLEAEGEGGALATRLEDFEFAKAIVRASPEPADMVDLSELDEGDARVEDVTEAKKPAKADDETLDDAEEAQAMREAMNKSHEETKKRIEELRVKYDSKPWYHNVFKSTMRHLGFCLIAYCLRLAYDHYSGKDGAAAEDAAGFVNSIWK